MNGEYVTPFLNATENLFREHLGLSLETGMPHLVEDNHYLSDVSGIIGLTGEVTGALVLSFSSEMAIKIISQFAGDKYAALDRVVIDGVGELVNIIAGNAKKNLSLLHISISVPGVVTGNRHQMNWPEDVPIISIPFYSNLGDFSINVALKKTR